MKNAINVRRPSVLILLTTLLSACAMQPVPFTSAEFVQQAQTDRQRLFADTAPVTKPLTLSDVLARVLLYNLDRCVKMMEESVALGQLDLDFFELLPKLPVNATLNHRSNQGATSSFELSSGTVGPPSYSTDRNSWSKDLGLTWNVLDFGVSWYNAHQNADRALIAEERRRKAMANLAHEVRLAYWQAVGAQVLHKRVAAVLQNAEKALSDLEKVEAEKLKDPVGALRVQKSLLENIRQLETVDQELTNAKAELAALAHLPPGNTYELATPEAGAIQAPTWTIPIEQMETLALAENPDLREQDYQTRIAVDETRKEMLKLLPGLSFNVTKKRDENSFVADHGWTEAGTKITWNLLNLLSAPDRIEQADLNEKMADTKRLALRMTILAQVHVGLNKFYGAAQQFKRADKLWAIETRLAKVSTQQSTEGIANAIERISQETSSISAELRRYQTFAQMHSAYGKLQATIGMDPLPKEVPSHEFPDLAKTIEERLKALEAGQKPAESKPKAEAAAPVASTASSAATVASMEPADSSGTEAEAPAAFSFSALFRNLFGAEPTVAPRVEADVTPPPAAPEPVVTTEVAPTAAQTVTVVPRAIALRAAPNGSHAFVKELIQGESLTLLQENSSGRLRVKDHKGTEGWIKRSLVKELTSTPAPADNTSRSTLGQLTKSRS